MVGGAGNKKPATEHAAVWVPDGDAHTCMHCLKTKFNAINRRVSSLFPLRPAPFLSSYSTNEPCLCLFFHSITVGSVEQLFVVPVPIRNSSCLTSRKNRLESVSPVSRLLVQPLRGMLLWLLTTPSSSFSLSFCSGSLTADLLVDTSGGDYEVVT